MMQNSQTWWCITYPLGLLVTEIFYGIFAGAMRIRLSRARNRCVPMKFG